MVVELVDATTNSHSRWGTTIQHKTYTVDDIVEVMQQRLEEAEDDYYKKHFSRERLRAIVEESMRQGNIHHITDNHRQRFLQALGTLRRKETHVVKYEFEAVHFVPTSTKERQKESVSASELRGGGPKTLFVTSETRSTMPDEAKEFYDEVTEQGRGYQCISIQNKYDFKTPLNAVIADHDNERRFIKMLVEHTNTSTLEAWIKSTHKNFYSIDYSWKKGEHPRQGVFNPDFFIKTKDLIMVVEIKSDEEIQEPSPENPKKYEYAIAHFDRLNEHLKKNRECLSYKFNFLTPSDFNIYFQCLRDGSGATFHSQLDVKLRE